jgi:hypothetical protein
MTGEGCGRGALAALVGKAITVNYTGLQDTAMHFAVTVVGGGVASMIAGGKFENGATTAAFGYLFNYCSSLSGSCLRAWSRALLSVGSGIAGVVTGVGLCGTGVGCAMRAPLTEISVGSVGEGADWLISGTADSEGRNAVKQGS